MNNDEICVICLDAIEKGLDNTISFSGCEHRIHSDCFFKYIQYTLKEKKQILCPTCRNVIININSDIVYQNDIHHAFNDASQNITIRQSDNEDVRRKFLKYCIFASCGMMLLVGTGFLDWVNQHITPKP